MLQHRQHTKRARDNTYPRSKRTRVLLATVVELTGNFLWETFRHANGIRDQQDPMTP